MRTIEFAVRGQDFVQGSAHEALLLGAGVLLLALRNPGQFNTLPKIEMPNRDDLSRNQSSAR
jgi:hypothetical protein